MNDRLEVARTLRIVRVSNIIIFIFNFLIAFGLIAIKLARATYLEISNELFSPEAPLMDSIVLDLLLRKSVAILVIVFLFTLVIKEKKIKSVRHRLCANLIVFAFTAGYASLLIYLIYSPVFHAT
jgi:hypothetical protein